MSYKSKKKPLLGHWLNELDKLKLSKIFINTHYKSEMVHSLLENIRVLTK